MFSSNLNLTLIGLEPVAQTALASVAPRENFEAAFYPEPPDSKKAIATDWVVADKSVDVTKLTIGPANGDSVKIIIVTDDAAGIAPELLARLTDVWPYGMTEELWIFHFLRLLEQHNKEMESYYYQACFNSMINALPDLIWVKDIKGSHLKVNDAFCQAVGKEKSDVEGRGHYYIWGLTEEMYKQGEYVCLETEEEVLRRGRTCLFNEQVQDTSGGLRELLTYKTPIRDMRGTIVGTLGVAHDITVENAQRRKIEELAYTDALTGLANRYAFYEEVNKRRQRRRLTLLIFDLNRFKSINDRYGHQTGDEALQMMARTLKDNFSDGICVRLGGDEFLVVLFDMYDIAMLRQRLNQYLNRFNAEVSGDYRFGQLSVSIGAAWSDDPNLPVDMILHQADVAMYKAKKEDTPANNVSSAGNLAPVFSKVSLSDGRRSITVAEPQTMGQSAFKLYEDIKE